MLYRSIDGVTWTAGAEIHGVSADTPLETELVVMPSGRMLGLVRMDGDDANLVGNGPRLRTKVCWALPPYDAWECPHVVARKHLLNSGIRKRTALYEITGELDGGTECACVLGASAREDLVGCAVAPVDRWTFDVQVASAFGNVVRVGCWAPGRDAVTP